MGKQRHWKDVQRGAHCNSWLSVPFLDCDHFADKEVLIGFACFGSGHRWLFTYNPYGEVVEVKTPSEGVIKYRYLDTSGVVELGTSRQIFRRLREWQVWVSAGEFEGRTTYSDPTQKDGNGAPLPVVEKNFGSLTGETPLLAATSH